MEGESSVIRSIIDQVQSLVIQGNQMEGESGVSGSINDDSHSLDIEGY